MALSNWATVAWNEKGNPCHGYVKFPDETEIEIYKNWIYVRDTKEWSEDSEYRKPTVMSIRK